MTVSFANVVARTATATIEREDSSAHLEMCAEQAVEAESVELERKIGTVEDDKVNKCAYESCAVTCGSNSPGSGGSCAMDNKGCTIQLTQQTCDLFGYKNGDRMPVESTIGKPLPDAEGSPSDAQVANTCVIRHEAQHACDGPSTPGPETERRAFEVQLKCLQDAAMYYCTGDERPQQLCDYLDASLPRYQAGVVYQTCRASGIGAADCLNRCTGELPGSADSCREMCRTYDPNVCR